ncbi:uncharacterized protein V6R79_012545 [Siganus canaliculatus]
MDGNLGFSEEDALRILKELYASCVAMEPLERVQRHSELQLQTTRRFLEGTGLTGSTCAFTEQILRGHGYRTGFFCSPHLVQVRERIRINGKPISKELFTKYFWQVYSRLDKNKDAHGGVMPTHFGFFTILAFHVFLQEKVDLAVIEVGIGGAYDCTNIIRRPWVCGVTSLGIDHTHILGDTVEKIAWHKGGIFKSGTSAFTVRQPENAMAVLRDRAKELSCPLAVCPDLDSYQTDCGPLRLGLVGRHQRANASLALQLCHAWLQKRCQPVCSLTTADSTGLLQAPSFMLGPVMVQGLADTEWPGRNQTLKHGAVTYFLDGAHTMRSMQACVDWFTDTAAQHERDGTGSVVRVLLFNTTGERDSAALLKLLVPCKFNIAVFCPNITEEVHFCDTGLQNSTALEDRMARCLDNENSWLFHNTLPRLPNTTGSTLVFPCILSALQWITQGRDPVLALPTASIMAGAAQLCEAAEIHVLITGSLHLVGKALKLLDPPSTE